MPKLYSQMNGNERHQRLINVSAEALVTRWKLGKVTDMKFPEGTGILGAMKMQETMNEDRIGIFSPSFDLENLPKSGSIHFASPLNHEGLTLTWGEIHNPFNGTILSGAQPTKEIKAVIEIVREYNRTRGLWKDPENYNSQVVAKAEKIIRDGYPNLSEEKIALELNKYKMDEGTGGSPERNW